MKVLFIVPYPTKGPSNRFRVQQYIPYLKEQGIDCYLEPFQTEKLYDIIYKKGHFLTMASHLAQATLKRAIVLLASKRFDAVFIHREAYPIGISLLERLFKLVNKKMIFDFDDSIFLSKPNGGLINFLKRNSKVSEIIKLSNCVIAGNNYLRDYALQFNKNVTVLPTCIDTDLYKPFDGYRRAEKIVIGWIGSRTTADYLLILKNVFGRLLDRFAHLEIKIVGADALNMERRIIKQAWSLDTEVQSLQSFDIGIMPMPDNPWTKGKCAFKIIQYMAVGIPCVASGVGMNIEVIQDGVNGFLAQSEEEWFSKLSMLIEDSKLRNRLGAQGHRTVEQRYSLKVNAPK